MGRRAKITAARRIEREQRIADILALRVSGWSLRAIGESLRPAISAQAVHKTICKAIERMCSEAVEQTRRIESLRLDEALAAIYPGVSAGDLVAIDRMLDLMKRRARLLGLDVRPMRLGDSSDSYGPDTPHVGVEIINNPAIERVRRLEAALEGRDLPRVTSLPSLN